MTLKIFAKSSPSAAGFEIHPETDAWTESGITWGNQPTWNSTVLATSTQPVSGNWVSLVLPTSSINVTSNTNYGLRYSTSGINATFSSREDSANQPQLIMTYSLSSSPTPTPTPVVTSTPLVTATPVPTITSTPFVTPSPSPVVTPSPAVSGDPIISAAGDMVCGSADVGKGYPCQGLATANLIRQINPVAVIALGDNQYESGSLADFNKYYNPTWGLFKLTTYPVPGNHEYGASGGNGYYTYFGSLASPQDTGCTTNCKGYYSYDIGNWHIVALNTECGKITGGCGVGSLEETWLKNDLAKVSVSKCIMAYWHEPRFTSGHDGNTSVATQSMAFVQDLYNAGADVILGGHSHDYERFAQQNPNGVATPNGFRQFVVGTGGRDFTGWWTTSLANSQIRNNNSFGVLKLTLHSTSYDWQFMPATGVNGYKNGTFTDSGSTSCH